MIDPRAEKEKAVCVVSPHAGYVYSGPVAGAVFSSILLPDISIILGPSHRGMRGRFALMKKGVWETPLGEVPIEAGLAGALMRYSDFLTEEEDAHLHEHSLEVQLPFLQFFKERIAIVPICVAFDVTYEELEDLAHALSSGIREFGQEVLLVASTDMSHYVSQETAQRLDFMAIQKIIDLDPKGLYDTVGKESISMCGFQPTTSALIAAKSLGAHKAELVKYQTSGDRTGDFHEVVGYAGMRII